MSREEKLEFESIYVWDDSKVGLWIPRTLNNYTYGLHYCYRFLGFKNLGREVGQDGLTLISVLLWKHYIDFLVCWMPTPNPHELSPNPFCKIWRIGYYSFKPSIEKVRFMVPRSDLHQVGLRNSKYIGYFRKKAFTYDHRLKRTGHPVRSAFHKLQIGRLVVGWVTTSEYLLLYVFWLLFLVICVFSPDLILFALGSRSPNSLVLDSRLSVDLSWGAETDFPKVPSHSKQVPRASLALF